jgi:16S rRNA (adenine1518-N6/adenine1519-N6)-dimethyltransferase
MTLLNTIKRELDILGIRPQKSLGQNFLVNEGIYKKIVAALEIKKDDTIVEIGPGLGTLTEYLAESPVRGKDSNGTSGANVIAVEKDYKLAEYLKTKFAGAKNVIITEGDILKFNPANCKLKAENYKLVGNIPYYLTSHLLRIVLEEWPAPELIVLMIQKEVAQRIIARPPKMSLLAVSVQYFSKPEIVNFVPKSSFYPVPKVDSAIIKLVVSNQFTVYRKNTENRELKTENLFRVVRIGFSGKRKQLANNLSFGLKLPKEKIEPMLLAIGINPKRRAETLTIEEWKTLANTLLLPD